MMPQMKEWSFSRWWFFVEPHTFLKNLYSSVCGLYSGHGAHTVLPVTPQWVLMCVSEAPPLLTAVSLSGRRLVDEFLQGDPAVPTDPARPGHLSPVPALCLSERRLPGEQCALLAGGAEVQGTSPPAASQWRRRPRVTNSYTRGIGKGNICRLSWWISHMSQHALHVSFCHFKCFFCVLKCVFGMFIYIC